MDLRADMASQAQSEVKANTDLAAAEMNVKENCRQKNKGTAGNKGRSKQMINYLWSHNFVLPSFIFLYTLKILWLHIPVKSNRLFIT